MQEESPKEKRGPSTRQRRATFSDQERAEILRLLTARTDRRRQLTEKQRRRETERARERRRNLTGDALLEWRKRHAENARRRRAILLEERLRLQERVKRTLSLQQYPKTLPQNIPYRCGICPRIFSNRFQLSQHRGRAHRRTDGQYLCEDCGKTTVKVRDMILHKKGRHNMKFNDQFSQDVNISNENLPSLSNSVVTGNHHSDGSSTFSTNTSDLLSNSFQRSNFTNYLCQYSSQRDYDYQSKNFSSGTLPPLLEGNEVTGSSYKTLTDYIKQNENINYDSRANISSSYQPIHQFVDSEQHATEFPFKTHNYPEGLVPLSSKRTSPYFHYQDYHIPSDIFLRTQACQYVKQHHQLQREVKYENTSDGNQLLKYSNSLSSQSFASSTSSNTGQTESVPLENNILNKVVPQGSSEDNYGFKKISTESQNQVIKSESKVFSVLQPIKPNTINNIPTSDNFSYYNQKRMSHFENISNNSVKQETASVNLIYSNSNICHSKTVSGNFPYHTAMKGIEKTFHNTKENHPPWFPADMKHIRATHSSVAYEKQLQQCSNTLSAYTRSLLKSVTNTSSSAEEAYENKTISTTLLFSGSENASRISESSKATEQREVSSKRLKVEQSVGVMNNMPRLGNESATEIKFTASNTQIHNDQYQETKVLKVETEVKQLDISCTIVSNMVPETNKISDYSKSDTGNINRPRFTSESQHYEIKVSNRKTYTMPVFDSQSTAVLCSNNQTPYQESDLVDRKTLSSWHTQSSNSNYNSGLPTNIENNHPNTDKDFNGKHIIPKLEDTDIPNQHNTTFFKGVENSIGSESEGLKPVSYSPDSLVGERHLERNIHLKNDHPSMYYSDMKKINTKNKTEKWTAMQETTVDYSKKDTEILAEGLSLYPLNCPKSGSSMVKQLPQKPVKDELKPNNNFQNQEYTCNRIRCSSSSELVRNIHSKMKKLLSAPSDDEVVDAEVRIPKKNEAIHILDTLSKAGEKQMNHNTTLSKNNTKEDEFKCETNINKTASNYSDFSSAHKVPSSVGGRSSLLKIFHNKNKTTPETSNQSVKYRGESHASINIIVNECENDGNTGSNTCKTSNSWKLNKSNTPSMENDKQKTETYSMSDINTVRKESTGINNTDYITSAYQLSPQNNSISSGKSNNLSGMMLIKEDDSKFMSGNNSTAEMPHTNGNDCKEVVKLKNDFDHKEKDTGIAGPDFMCNITSKSVNIKSEPVSNMSSNNSIELQDISNKENLTPRMEETDSEITTVCSVVKEEPEGTFVYVCLPCELILRSNEEYDLHQETQHASTSTTEDGKRIDIELKKDQNEVYVCRVCNAVMKTKKALQRHNRINHKAGKQKKLTREKNHVCKICGRKFVFGHLLQDHMNSHTGVTPYSCLVCGVKLSMRSELMCHVKLHRQSFAAS